jgi:DNA replication protein DnaC
VVTTNRTFREWNQMFADDAIAHAILDRLAERAEVFHLEWTSHRETHRRPAPKVSPSLLGLHVCP